MRIYQITVDTYEPGSPFPIVTHVFRGTSPTEARAYEAAHKRSDAFFRDCGSTGLFAGTVRCRNVRRSESWVEI